jgi:hypothetical protein
MFTRIMDTLRPKNSTMSPDIRLPIGWQMNAMLPAKKWAALETGTVSSEENVTFPVT